MNNNFPGNQAPNGNLRSAQYSKFYAAGIGSPVNLTTEIQQARGACSGMLLQHTAATNLRFAYKDCAGNAVDSGVIGGVQGSMTYIPLAATELTFNASINVWVYWHPQGNQ